MARTSTRTTITLPLELLSAVDDLVRQGKARSRNDLVVNGLRLELLARERAAIDAAFTAMADDLDELEEAHALAEEFATADWEALQLGEAQS